MARVLERLDKDLTTYINDLQLPEAKTILASEVNSIPSEALEFKGFIEKAFKAVPLDYLDRPLLELIIYYTEGDKGKITVIQKSLKELREKDPFFSNQVIIRKKTREALVQALKRHQKVKKDNENLLFIIPERDIVISVKEANVLVHEDRLIPDQLSFIKPILSEIAIGLSKALSRSEEDPLRAQYLDYLKGELTRTSLVPRTSTYSGLPWTPVYNRVPDLFDRFGKDRIVRLCKARAAKANAPTLASPM